MALWVHISVVLCMTAMLMLMLMLAFMSRGRRYVGFYIQHFRFFFVVISTAFPCPCSCGSSCNPFFHRISGHIGSIEV
jgi:hypothetical protein